MKKFLIINPFGIGDVLFTTPVVRAIKDAYPDSVIAYWCNERAEGVLKNNPGINKTFALSRGDLKRIYHKSRLEGIRRFLGLLRKIRKEKFDISLDFSLDHRYSLVSKLLGIKRRIGFDYKKRGRFLTHKVNIDGYHSKHIVEYYLDLLQFLGISAKSHDLELSVPEGADIKSKKFFSYVGIKEKNLVVGIAAGAGASWGRDAGLKHWPPLKYAQLADRIINDYAAKVLILGDEAESPIADIIVNAMSNKAVNLVGKTNLEELIAVIKNLDMLITNDGGPLHIAAALGKKTVSFFGPVDPKVYGPYPYDEKRHIVLKKAVDCSPCYRNFRLSECLKDKQCLRDIGLEEAVAAVSMLLA